MFDSQVFEYDVRTLSAIEERLGAGNPIAAQSYVHGVAPLGELTTCYDVAAQPLWITKSRGSYVSPIIADTTDRTYLWHMDKLRIPHAGWVTGVRVRLVTDLDASSVSVFQFIFFHGTDTAAMSVRGRTENIDKSRLLNRADGYAWIQFQKPVYCHGGEWLGLRVQTSSSTANTVRLNCIVPGAKVNELSTAAVSADGLTVTGTNWSSAGVVAGDYVYMTNGSGTDANVRTVVSANTTDMVVTPAYSGTLTNRYVCVGDAVIAEYNKSGLLRMSTNPSDTATNAVNTTFTNYPLQSGFPGFFLMTRPVVALTGDSVMGGTGQTGAGTGSLHEHHVATAEYKLDNDMANWLHRFAGIPATNASRGGSYIHVYMDKYDQSNPLWGYLNQQWASVAEYRPSIVIYNSIHNDCNDLGVYIPTDAQYLAALDLLNHHCYFIGAKLVLTTGTPLDARDSASQVRGQRFRALTRHFCARNGVPLIDTERLFHVAQVEEGNEDCWHDTNITTVFSRPLYDYYFTDAIHPNSAGSDGANAYKTMGKYMADSLMNPVNSQLVALLWRIQTFPSATLDNTIAGVTLNQSATTLVADAVTAAAGLGTGATARDIVVTVEDEDEEGVAGARLHVLTDGEVATNLAPTTGVGGAATLRLNDGDYILRVVSPSGFATVADIEFTVSSSETPIAVTLDSTTVTPTPEAGLCTVYTTVLDPSGEFMEGATMRARLVDPNSGPNGAVITNESIEAESDEEGYVSLDLIRADQFADGTGEYQITVSYAGEILRNITVTIPNQDSVNLEDLATS